MLIHKSLLVHCAIALPVQMATYMQASILTSWVQMLLCLGPWEGEQLSEQSSMTPGGSMVSKCGCEEVNVSDYRLWFLSFYLTTTCLNPLSAYLSLSSRASVCSDPADPWQCRKEWRQTLFLFPWEDARLQQRCEPQRYSQSGKSVSGEQNHCGDNICNIGLHCNIKYIVHVESWPNFNAV